MSGFEQLFPGKLPRLVMFDLDGTLVDSVPDLAVAVDQMLLKLGRKPVGIESVRDWVGNGVQMLVRRALANHIDAEGVDEVEAAEIVRDVRRRDTERLELQVAGGLQAGRWLMRGNMATPTPEPFSVPRHGGKALNTEAADVLAKSPKQLAE